MANRRLTYGMEMYKERGYPDWMLGCFDHFGYDQADETDKQRFVDDLITYQTLLAVNTHEQGYRGLRVRRSIEESEWELAELPRCEWKVPLSNRQKRRTRRIARLQRRGSLDSWWLQPAEQRRGLQESLKRACFEAITRPTLLEREDVQVIPDTPPAGERTKRIRREEDEEGDESKLFWDRYYAAQRRAEQDRQTRMDKYWQSPDLFATANEGGREEEPDLVCLETMKGAPTSQDTIILPTTEAAGASRSPTPPVYSPISSAQQSPTEVRLSRARSSVELWERRVKANEMAIEAGKDAVDRLIVESKGRTLMTTNHEARMDRLKRLVSTGESYRQSLRDAKDQLELIEREEASLRKDDDCYVDGEDSFTFGRMTELMFD